MRPPYRLLSEREKRPPSVSSRMQLKPLHDLFIETMMSQLQDWKFIASNRHFRLSKPGTNFYLHAAFINHQSDFDVVLDVAIEFVKGKNRVGIVGAELGNIEGIGQVRHSVSSHAEASSAAMTAVADFNRVGLPFLERYCSLSAVIGALQASGAEARLISPIEQLRPELISALLAAQDAAHPVN